MDASQEWELGVHELPLQALARLSLPFIKSGQMRGEAAQVGHPSDRASTQYDAPERNIFLQGDVRTNGVVIFGVVAQHTA